MDISATSDSDTDPRRPSRRLTDVSMSSTDQSDSSGSRNHNRIIEFSSDSADLNISITRSQSPVDGPATTMDISVRVGVSGARVSGTIQQYPQQQPTPIEVDGDDDSIILIPPVIETIDLSSTLALPKPNAFRLNEVIEIPDDSPAAGPSRSRVAPRPKPLDDSLSSEPVRIKCPICFESVIGREPVSTKCGHVFCKQCIQSCLQLAKKCPMCKSSLGGRTPFHGIFLGWHCFCEDRKSLQK